jgi:iron complex outermembrane receptor protein
MEKLMIKNVLNKFGFVRIALVASVGCPLIFASNAFAQEPPPPPAGEVERVVVTGSLIPTAEEVTANPVDFINRQEIQASGQATDILNVLVKRDPDFVGAGNLGQTNANISSGGTQGGSIIQIRGLPTLVLLENRRFADSAAIASGGIKFKDVSLFPTALVSRIEVLKDGASATYGSEAVGGVVNIFLRDDFTGLEIGTRYGTTLESAVAERRSYVLAGVGTETTHIMAGAQYYEIDPLFSRQRAYSSPDINGTTTYGGAGRDFTGFYLIDNLVPINWPAGSSINSPLSIYAPHSIPADAPGYGSMPDAYRPSSLDEILSYDLSQLPTSTLDISNTSAYASFTHKICGDGLEAFGSFMYAHNHNESRLNAQPLSNNTGVIILGTERVDPNTGELVPEDRGPPAPYTPFQLSIDGNTSSGAHRLLALQRYQKRGSVFNPRVFTQDNDFYRLLGGLRSQITGPEHGNWFAEGAVQYSHYAVNAVNRNLVIADRLNELIAAQDAFGNPIPGTTLDFFALNPLQNGDRSISAANFNSIFDDNIRRQDSFLRSFDLHVTGELFELPGGPVGAAVGVQYGVEGFKIVDSPEIFVGSVPVGEIQASRNSFAAFAELRIPIVGSQMKVPGIYSLELTLAGRYESFEGISGDSKVPKVMLRYQPIPDLTLRGTFSNSFLAPDLFSLFGPQVQGFSSSISLNGVPQDQAQVLAGSNPDLVPSTAQSWTAGLVYSPKFVPGLTISVDYFWTLQQLIVGVIPDTTILNSVNNLGTASPYADLVAFNNFPGQSGSRPITAPNQLFGNMASVFFISNLRNIGAERVEGLDLNASYNMDLRDFGQVLLGVRSVLFLGHDLRTTPESKYFNINGLIGDEGFGANPEYRVTFLFEHRFRGFTLSASANYIPEMRNMLFGDPEFDDQEATFPIVDDYITVDGRLSYEFHFPTPVEPMPVAGYSKGGKEVVGKEAPPPVVARSCWSVQNWLEGLTLAVGCNNMFDEDPRFVEGGNSGTNLAVYDPFGRFVYFEIVKKF